MAALKATEKLPVGSIPWLAEEKASALKIAEEESEDFAFCARNEVEWLNEHVADIFSENHISVKDIFKTPGKLRGKTPRTARKRNPLETRAPLTDIFSSTPHVQPSSNPIHFEKHKTPKFQVAKDDVQPVQKLPSPIEKTTMAPNKAFYDSGYHGSQSLADEYAMDLDETVELLQSPQQSSSPKTQIAQPIEESDVMDVDTIEPEARRTTEESFRSAHEEQMLPVYEKEASQHVEENDPPSQPPSPVAESTLEQSPPKQSVISPPVSPLKSSPERPAIQPEREQEPEQEPEPAQAPLENDRPVSREDDVTFDDAPSEGSSPIRPIVRKSSLSFASLPAREPITTKQSIGNRISRTSHLDQNRQSYFGRPTGGKSLGTVAQISAQQEARRDDANRMELDTDVASQKPEISNEEPSSEPNTLQLHNKTSTQRLQDQISKLGQSQSNAPRPSKSIPNLTAISQPTYPSISRQVHEEPPSTKKARPTVLPGAFPDDEDESWIGPPHSGVADALVPVARPGITKGYSEDVLESIQAKKFDFVVPKQRGNESSPPRQPEIPGRSTSIFGHAKSASTSRIKSPKKDTNQVVESPYKKGISVSNPSIHSGHEDVKEPIIPPTSPTRSYRDSPLKASKDKISSILKFSKSLFASGAALSAEAKSSGFTPASKRFANPPSIALESENVLTQPATDQNLYPTLEQVVDEPAPSSPSRTETSRKTRASTERDEKRKEKEAKEAARMVAQLDKLEKAREKEKEKARVFSQEQEKAAAAEKQAAMQAEQEKLAKASQVSIPRTTRSSPRKTKAQLEAEGRAAAALPASENEDDISETPIMPPPAIPRTAMASQIGKPRDLPKRPGRPLKEPASKAKQAPMIIRVDTGSQRNQNHPSNSVLAASLQASLAPSASSHTGLKSKVNPSVAPTKAPTTSFSSSMSSTGTGRPRALESAARKKEQDEREAQRKRDIKMENERKLEEKRQDQQRKKDAERLREKEREQLEAKKSSQAARQALIKRKEVEMAKQQRAPPPAARPQPIEDSIRPTAQEKSIPPAPQRMNQAPPRPGSRMDNARSQEDLGRPINMVFHNTTKAPPKRPFQQDASEDSRPILQRSGPSYQQNEGKRRKTSEDFQEPDMLETQNRQMAPPIRQSSIRPKDGPAKSLFSNGYAHAPPVSHAGPSLHKATLQHLHQSKPAHPMDMAQVSKANISFAASSSQQVAGPAFKTPARPAGANTGGKSTAKSLAKSSPRYQNGDDINLPEIHTDSEDEDDDEGNDFAVPDWADSPALRDQLAAQDSIDPAEVFGPMPELKMEEIFKNKDRWNRFRARTSSANWSGSDRLTDDEIRKDLEGRERIQREGGWTYGLS